MTYPDILTIATQVMEIDRLTIERDQARAEADHYRQQAGVWRAKFELVNCDYDDLRRDFHCVGDALARAEAELTQLRAVRADYDKVNEKNSCLWIEVAEQAQRIAELEAELGRSEDRRYEP